MSWLSGPCDPNDPPPRILFGSPKHEPGEQIRIYWPGGPHNFIVEFVGVEPVTVPGWEGWVVLTGLVVEPDGPEHRTVRPFYVQPTTGGYRLLPVLERGATS